MTWSTLIVAESADRVEVRLHRPEHRNAIDQAMIVELHRVCRSLERDPKILILAGSDGVFASGADIGELRSRGRSQAFDGVNSRLFDRVARLPMPVIAAIDGYTLGGGAELAYAADFRLAGEALVVGNPETSLGIMAAAGATWRLAQLIGEPLAKEILLAGRRLDAREALSAGLVTGVFRSEELLAAAHALADRISRNDPLATRMTKLVMRSPRDAHPAIDDAAQATLFESPEKERRMTAFLEGKRN
jgi:enoyl-CoA hydratase